MKKLKFLLKMADTYIVDRLVQKKEITKMYGYIAWPGVYSFKEELGLFLEYCKEQIDDVMKKIEETEDLVAK